MPPASDSSASPTDDRDPTPGEVACFESGIKFGSLYHQFAGTPVSPASADSLATAMEESIENQPHCTDVTVEVDTDALERELADSSADYTELTGRFMEVEIVVERDGRTVTSQMAMEEGYPLMTVVSIRPDASHGNEAPE